MLHPPETPPMHRGLNVGGSQHLNHSRILLLNLAMRRKMLALRIFEGIYVSSDMRDDAVRVSLQNWQKPKIAADNIVKAFRLYRTLQHDPCPKIVIAVGGTSGSGKSELASVLGSYFMQFGKRAYILSEDNYPYLPPRDNDQRRKQIFDDEGDRGLRGFLGTDTEIDYRRISRIVKSFHAGHARIPLKIMNNSLNRTEQDSFFVDFANVQVLLIEGTWACLVPETDYRIFLDTTPETTLKRRIKRGRDPISEFGERVLAREQELLTLIRSNCGIIVHDDCSLEVIHVTSTGPERERELRKLRTFGTIVSRQIPHASLDETDGLHRARPSASATTELSKISEIAEVDRKEAQEQTKEFLKKVITRQGILASAVERTNYRRIWARDSVIVGLGGLLGQDNQVIEGLRCSLETLASCQSESGNIPSNVEVDPKGNILSVSYGGLAGRVDPVPWFVIGTCNYATLVGDIEFAEKMQPAMSKALQLLTYWEVNNRKLINVPAGGDWADEYIHTGYVLLPQLLRLWACQCYAKLFNDSNILQFANELRTIINVNYWPRRHLLDSPAIYHKKAYFDFLEISGDAEYFQVNLSPFGYRSMQFDFFGNAVASILNIGEEVLTNQLLEHGTRIRRGITAGVTPSFWPPILPDEPAYEDLKTYRKDKFRNIPFEYQNGGGWPMLTGWWGLANMTHGKAEEALSCLTAINEFNHRGGVDLDEWGFYEFCNSATGLTGGMPFVSWSASASRMVEGALSNKTLMTG